MNAPIPKVTVALRLEPALLARLEAEAVLFNDLEADGLGVRVGPTATWLICICVRRQLRGQGQIRFVSPGQHRPSASGSKRSARRSCYPDGSKWVLADEYLETENVKRADRPKLAAALAYAKATATTVVFAKLDRGLVAQGRKPD
jgi:hypothetical protein